MFYTEDVLYEFHVFVEHEYLHNCSVTYLHSSFRYNGMIYAYTNERQLFEDSNEVSSHALRRLLTDKTPVQHPRRQRCQ